MRLRSMIPVTSAAVAFASLMPVASADASKEVLYGKEPGWVVPRPAPTTTAAPSGAPVRTEHFDVQIHAGPAANEVFTAWRVRILKPEGLAVGTVVATWNPDAGDTTVHYLRIRRGESTIDVLASSTFEVARQEDHLEQAMLHGHLTATLQVPGLQVGDELELAATTRHRDRTLGDRAFGAGMLPPMGLPGAYRLRLLWPASRRLTWRTTPDVPTPQERVHDGVKEVTYELRDPEAVIFSTGAPVRMHVRRAIEFSDFASWREVSSRLSPLYLQAAALPPGTPIREEAARIAAATPDAVRRTEAALALVQDRIRYVYVGMNGGNYQPATLDETWTRRYGDCKAKTVLLLALLRELGVEAEPVLVNSQGGDGLDERLPSPGLFDHVIVRARVGGAVHWLDGTRRGDSSLRGLLPPRYRWVLPLRAGGADLEAVPAVPPRSPTSITVLDIDTSGAFEARNPVKADVILRGDEAQNIRSVLAAMTAADAERAVRTYFDREEAWLESDKSSWAYDDARAVLRLSVVGTAKPEWEGDDEDGRERSIPGAGFSPPAEYRRPKEQDQAAPWIIDHPEFRCYATTIRLPPASAKWKWDYRAKPVHRTMGGVTYWRVADLRDGVMRTVMSKRYEVREISAAEAAEVNRLLPQFDNKVSRVLQIAADKAPAAHPALAQPPFGEATDWMAEATPCDAPALP